MLGAGPEVCGVARGPLVAFGPAPDPSGLLSGLLTGPPPDAADVPGTAAQAPDVPGTALQAPGALAGWVAPGVSGTPGGLVGSAGVAGVVGGFPTVSAAEAKRSSRESAATEGPASPLVSSYNCRHQSSS
ncbi:hypothetical protein [Streptomyces sp. NBC_01314]|uniref:hypothetical protein n=1 Tax=Streptomyces sp. NBC_01314 TaxID=2903821 RepID=UPI00308ACCBC|nr:hypothetical protein OG622_12020 [Streptomyces sp. NBC_01314]